MNKKFQDYYQELNKQQQLAVDSIEGPVLVIAGPGTGKTQLLTLRVANILKNTDSFPENILCLTFTDNAARNMRERLEQIIGQPAYHVSIHTFHSFGGDIINKYPDYFTGRQLLQQIDELGRYELLRAIFDQLPHSNPLSTKVGENFIHIKDTLSVISWLKQNALKPSELLTVLQANQTFINESAQIIAKTFSQTPSPKQRSNYELCLLSLQKQATETSLFGFPNYASLCASELQKAIELTPETGRYAPRITAWRNSWCHKDELGNHVMKDGGRNLQKMYAVHEVYTDLLKVMSDQGLYDFDDMIIEVVQALEHYDDLRFSLQERYQYVLVDEFQDTNKAQLRMLSALGNNPVYEKRPNIMAVGDDDQAIYAFQGAEVSNMVAFSDLYRNPTIVTLQDNYRSSEQILAASFSIAEQITNRLESVLPGTHKQPAAKVDYPNTRLTHTVFSTELAQYDWIAEQIEIYMKQGTKPEEIAVISPRHKFLERLVPYLGNRKLPVAYERRENILESAIILQLLTMARLVTAIEQNQQKDVDVFLSQVLGYDFWGIDTATLVSISLTCYEDHKHWLETTLNHDDKKIAAITGWFIGLAKQSTLEPMEYMLDQFMGGASEGVDSEYEDLTLTSQVALSVSPMHTYYFSEQRFELETDRYLELLGQLSTLRRHLREWKPNRMLFIKDFVDFANLHESAQLKIVDTNPHTQTTNAIQVMTAYKAKGLEFEVVFVINAQDEVWGSTARSGSASITLPKNLPVAPSGDDDNDKLRLLFVALTRAKHSLFVTSYTHNLDNKLSPGLSFIGGNADIIEDEQSRFKPTYIDKPATVQASAILSTDWAYRFRQIMADKPVLFEPILANYKLSVTHLNNFIDITGSGPEYFFLHNLLRFPEAPTPAAAYGDAVHKTLQWSHSELRATSSLPTLARLQNYFADLLDRKHLRASDQKRLEQRGREALSLYFKQRSKTILAADAYERGFSNEGVVIGDANLSGTIDKLHFSNGGKAEVVDFKTGKPSLSWQGKDAYELIKLHKYRQQLLFYKLLIENSASFSNKLIVTEGALEFVEPNAQGKLVDNLKLSHEDEELARFALLIAAVWRHIMELNFPVILSYSKNLAGIKRFEQDLIDGII